MKPDSARPQARGGRVYLNTTDEGPPAWTVPVEEALREAREASQRASTAIVDALIALGTNADSALVDALVFRMERLEGALMGSPFDPLLKSEWAGGDSLNARNHRRYLEGPILPRVPPQNPPGHPHD